MAWIIARDFLLLAGLCSAAYMGWGYWRNSDEDKARRTRTLASLDAGAGHEARLHEATFTFGETPEGCREALVCIEGGKAFGALRTNKGEWGPWAEISKPPVFFHER